MKLLKQKREIVLSKLIFLVLFGSFGAFASFLNLHFEQVVGLTGSQIGFITFVGMIAAVIMNPISGYIADKTGAHELILRITFFAAAALGAIYAGSQHFLLIVIVSAVFEGLRAPISPMIDYLSTSYCVKHQYDYGKVRVYASWGFLSVAMATGFMVAGFELDIFGHSIGFPGFISLEFAAFGIFIIMSSLGVILSCLLPKPDKTLKQGKEVAKKGFEKKDVRALLRNRRFVFIVVLSMVGFMALESAYGFATMHIVTSLGASENFVSWLVFFMVGPELLIVPLGTVLVFKMGLKNWYIFSLMTMIFRLLVYSFAVSPLVFALGGMVHAIMVVMHVAGTFAYVRHVVEPKVLGLAFTILSSSLLLSRAFFSFAYGFIYENVSSFAVFQFAAIIVSIALLMAIKSKHLKEVGAEIGII